MEELMSFHLKSQPMFRSPRRSARFTLLVLVALSALLLCSVAFAQTTIGTGSITGTVTDPTRVVVGGAKVVITNTGTGQSLSLTAKPSGRVHVRPS
jgi:type 1 fimbria pilin